MTVTTYVFQLSNFPLSLSIPSRGFCLSEMFTLIFYLKSTKFPLTTLFSPTTPQNFINIRGRSGATCKGYRSMHCWSFCGSLWIASPETAFWQEGGEIPQVTAHWHRLLSWGPTRLWSPAKELFAFKYSGWTIRPYAPVYNRQACTPDAAADYCAAIGPMVHSRGCRWEKQKTQTGKEMAEIQNAI